MKLLLLNLLILGLSSLWMGCDCDQAGGKVQGKQCKKDSGDAAPGATSGADNPAGEIVHIRDLDGQSIRTPVNLGWDEVSGASYYMIRLHQRGGDCREASSLYELRVDAPATNAIVDPNVDDGEYTLCVVAYDGSDQVIEPIQSADIIIDNTGPLGLATESIFGETAHVEIVVTLPNDVFDYERIALYRSEPLGAMPACEGEPRHSWAKSSLLQDAVLSYDDSVAAEYAGYALNYMVCAYDALGNVSEYPMANVRTTQMEHSLFFSDNYNGNLGGLSGADDKCQTEAGAAGLTGDWKAIIADNATSVLNHVSMRGPVKNMQGAVVARSINQLLEENLATDIKFDENGAGLTGLVWTGSASDGSPLKGKTCHNWSSLAGSATSAYGDLSSGSFIGNNQSASGACNVNKRLACVNQIDPKSISNPVVATDGSNQLQINISFDYVANSRVEVRRQDGAAAVSGSCVDPSDEVVHVIDALDAAGGSYAGTDVHDSFGRFSYRICVFDRFGGPAVSSRSMNSVVAEPASFEEIFVTTEGFQGDMGGDTPDEKCEAAGLNAGLTNNWEALISDDSQDASSLLGSAIPMMNLSAEVVVNDSSSIWSDARLASLAINEFADNVESDVQVWTGTTTTGVKASASDRCNNWTNASSGSSGFVGVVGGSGSQWILKGGSPTSSCDNFKRLYCIRK